MVSMAGRCVCVCVCVRFALALGVCVDASIRATWHYDGLIDRSGLPVLMFCIIHDAMY